MRWTLRERGTALAGPDQRAFVAEVPADTLRSRMRSKPAAFEWPSWLYPAHGTD